MIDHNVKADWYFLTFYYIFEHSVQNKLSETVSVTTRHHEAMNIFFPITLKVEW